MAKLTKEEIIKLARLSKIKLSESEVETIRVELESILGHVEQLQSIDTEGIEPTYQVSGLKNITRK
ncbi:Asp-tRNA(Asn)/Glu-tRNA(Gln) amidotransferase subunit GatC, partial [Candidatus Saccharibacteria bacterium]|nr:Asp-tRNA(Asn)/Glu-tRNA(Gln) amidotransferase subunit GatC [Candidatus Saccharibacteria bacterium]